MVVVAFFFFFIQAFRAILALFSVNASNKYFYIIHLPTHLLFILLMKTIFRETSVAEEFQNFHTTDVVDPFQLSGRIFYYFVTYF